MSLLLTLALLTLQATPSVAVAPFRIHVVGQRHENVGKVWVRVPASSKSEAVLYPDDEGTVSIPNLPIGTTKVSVAAYGYQTWNSDLQVTGKQERPLVVTLKNAELGCSPHYFIRYDNEPGLSSVRGVVNDGASRTLSRIQMDWQRPGEEKPFLTISSEKRGRFEVPQMAPGTYKVIVNPKAGWNREHLSFEVVIPSGEVPFITINLALKNAIELCL